MRRFVKGALLGSAAAAVACGGRDSTAPSARPEPTSVSLDASRFSRGEQSVTGSAAVNLPPNFGGAREFYTLRAVRHGDGSVSGHVVEVSRQQGGQRMRGKIFCFTIAGDTARVAALVEKSTVPFGPVGTYVVWTLVDNGRGKRAHPDQTTDFFFNGTQAQAQQHCDVGLREIAPLFPSIRGNLEVRG